MTFAIKLNNQFRGCTIKVDDKRFDRMLATEFQAAELSAT